jgi:hypothetical protein
MRTIAPGLAGLAVQLALSAGVLAPLPVALRIALAFVVLVLLPGHALLRALRTRPPGGAALASGWALGLGVAWAAVLVLVTRLAHQPFTVLAGASALPNALLWLLPALARRPESDAAEPALGRATVIVVMAAAALALVHVSVHPTPVSYYSDSPDHIGTIRRMMHEGDAFPVDAFFRDAGRSGADPRKGLWHPVVALVATLARADALDAWRVLAALLAPLFALNAAAFGFLVGGSAAAGVAAWALVLTYGGSMAAQYLREAVFSTKLADQLALATVTAVLADLGRRRRRDRVVAVALALGAVLTHVFAGLQFAIVFGAFALALLVRDRAASPAFRRFVVTAAAVAVAILPYLLWRARLSYAPSNVIHLEPQGLLWLAPGVRVVSIGVLWDWLGALWLVFPLSLPAWWRGARRDAVLWLLSTTLVAGTLMFCPPVVAALEPRLGYLLMRFVWLLPLSGALAFAIPSLARTLARGNARSRLGAALASAGLLALLAPVLADALTETLRPARQEARDDFDSTLRWRDGLAWMDAHLPPGSVVLSDPATSYSIPMMTRHWVTTLVDQHSSPNDSLALARILDARDALDPYSSWARTGEVVARWGATAIVLNDRFAEIPRLDYWAPSHEWFVRARARLDRAPAAFDRVLDSPGFLVYRIHRDVLDTLSGGGGPRPYVVPLESGRRPLASAVTTGPAIMGFALSRSEVSPGDTVGAVLEWSVTQPLPAGSWHVAVRFDRPLPDGVRFPGWCEKPARKVLEKLRHGRFRFRADHLPVGGDFGVDLWRPGESVRDSFAVQVPGDILPGPYRVEAVMLREPHYPNFRLSDYFRDRDYYSGTRVGTLRVTGPANR